MKRIIPFLLCLVFIFTFCACKSEKPESQDSILVYFRTGDSLREHDTDCGVIGYETRATDAKNITNAMNMLLWGPVDKENFTDIVPANLEILELKQENSTVIITFSEEYSKLSKIDMSIANACITETLTQFDTVEKVVISYFLSDGSSQAESFTSDSFELVSSKIENEEYSVRIYYPNNDGYSLISLSENLVAAEPEKVMRYILESLLDGTNGRDSSAAIFSDIQVINVYIDDGICYVNLGNQFLNEVPEDSSTQLSVIYSIVDSLTEMEYIDAVQILVEGKIQNYYGEIRIDEPLKRDESLIYKEGNYYNTILYLKREGDSKVSPHFWQIDLKEYATNEQLIVQTLLNMEIPQGYEQLFPSGTRLQTIATRDNVCYVDLTEELLTAETSRIIYGAYSITASLIQLDEIDSVELTCRGKQINIDGFKLPVKYDANNIMMG